MDEIGYKAWGLIPVDGQLSTTGPSILNPPMLVNLALDGGASLVFELAVAATTLHIRIKTTAISAAPNPNQSYQLYTGPTTEQWQLGQIDPWSVDYDGPTAQFNTKITAPGPFLKLHYSGPLGIVITSAHFSII
ncbi:MAG: hypothetical protein ACI8PG_003050 [Planctomycetota bacterium]|jgi:hypothetical protein